MVNAADVFLISVIHLDVLALEDQAIRDNKNKKNL
jgi:hypothetical protein